MAYTIITWLWGKKYASRDVARLANACRENFSPEHRFHVFTDQYIQLPGVYAHAISDPGLCERSCFCRLRMFDPIWQEWYGFDGKIISLDLDIIITGAIDHLFAGDTTFRILRGANATNPNPYNASVMMLRAGHHADIWSDFSIEAADKIQRYDWADDQGWIWHKFGNKADGWQAGKASGIYAFQKPGWPSGTLTLPEDARIVTFIGSRKPQQFQYLPWVQKHWTEAA